MALNLPTFYKRTASAIVFGIIMLAGLLWNPLSFLGLVCLIQVLCYREYGLLMKKIFPDAYWPAWLTPAFAAIGLVLTVLVALLLLQTNGGRLQEWDYIVPVRLLKGMAIVPAILFMVALLSKKDFYHALVLAIFGLCYILVPMLSLLYLYDTNSLLPLTLILMIWTNDTMQYLVGSFIGKTPFSPISPKKTWEGTIGGSLLTVVGAAVYGYFSKGNMLELMALALCASVAGTLGDLIESKLKRLADVKDSGNIMPGHGGALDRFDSLLVAAPFAFVCIACIFHVYRG
jgi:phosphatidate cytidylyltransferase